MITLTHSASVAFCLLLTSILISALVDVAAGGTR